MAYRLVSLDLFNTLVDLDAIVRPLWEGITGGPCTDSQLAAYADALVEGYGADYRAAAERSDFLSMREIFTVGFARAFQRLGMSYDAADAADRLIREHDRAPFFPEVPAVLRTLAARCPIAVSSDADLDMVRSLLTRIPHRYEFLSERLRVYKRDAQGRFFAAVLRETGLRPQEILHVGDGATDVLGAGRAGLAVCHVLRRPEPSRRWEESERPRYTIRSLEELPALIDGPSV